ncbi:MAG: succinate dehydrogenase cytochrome b subunit [Candidatus Neomarinimicrobiota bacterium]|nr:succinate dehydrogenase [Candidatus Neomarinimicrobiota bacterium]MEC7935154.1 succinate dehydrogenase cytochrome b subunit [Candidatus Neomarinimicrobiota bacterium]MED5255684.1 succinate dehydrogenase cytochrome b subunit [Candidatus Neomarinimicrobiota bacterium]|tara:strand:+ start:363 stop:1034 length:672 start_codon:yes stop_codon:yes gene_type:complete
MVNKSISIFNTTIGKKLLVASTGLMVCLFLVFHLINNLIIFTGPENFNQLVAALEKIKPLIRIMEILLVIIFFTHIYNSLLLTIESRRSRNDSYIKLSSSSSTIYSRTMFFSGSILFIFIVTHLSTIWFNFQNIDDHDKYYYLVTESVYGFGNIFITILYLLSMILLGFHLRHGFQSAFKTLGVQNSKFDKILNVVSIFFWFIIPLGFFSIAFWFGILDGGKL